MPIQIGKTWRAKLLRRAEVAPFRHWLSDCGSLTARLQAKGKFSVCLIRQGIAIPTNDEAFELQIKQKKIAWIREVALFCDEIPVVFAHTVLPYQPQGPLTKWLARLGNRSLGALLFTTPRFSRSTITCKRIDQRHALFQPAIKAMHLTSSPPTHLWARRSCFSFASQSILVTEIFSPALCVATRAP